MGMKYSLFILIAFIVGCDTSPTNKQKSLKENPEIKELGNNQQQTYNILWLSAEDLSPRLAAYGDSTIATPNIDRLAQEGIVFEQVYCTAGVCAPSRNAIIT
ncbi:MAG: sulfatase-like hydrolase/transferase, partial [Allomuricauda sp.]